MSTSAQGIDVSSFQVDLTVHDLSGLSFAFTKATDGLSITDPHFAANWAAIKAAGLHRGAYCELQAGSGAAQASRFLVTVQARGLDSGDMLAVVASDYPGVTDTEVLAFCEVVHAATAGRNPVLAYTDLSVGRGLTHTSGAGYPLWVAWPSSAAPPMPLAGWHDWAIWQLGTRNVPGLGSVDADSFNGSPTEMSAWIASFKPKPSPPKPTPKHVALAAPASGDDDMAVLAFDTAGLAPVSIPATLSDGVTPVSGLQLVTTGPAQVQVAFDGGGYGSPVSLDWSRGAATVPVPAGATAAKVQRLDSGSNYVAATFA